MTLFACIFILGTSVYAFTSSDYIDNQNINVGLESMEAAQLNITLNGDYTSNGVVYKSGTSYLIKASGSQVNFNGILLDTISLTPSSPTNTIKISSSCVREYRGILNFKITTSLGILKVIPINTVYIEDYLKGVVGKEMSDYFPIEALKAQAVAARNYALANISKHNSRGYSLCDTTDCQVYGGYDATITNVIAAVDATKGKVLLSGTSIVTGFYSASDGGYTEDSQNVWGGVFSYLKTKKDDFDGYDINYIWNKTFTSKAINDLLKLNPKVQPTDAFVKIDLSSITEFDSGRIKNISLIFKNSNGDEHTLPFGKEDARTFLGLKSALYSVCYDPITDIYTFNGKGNGHGVGMSQIGAKNRAAAGQSFDTILKFYYDGTTLLNVVDNCTVTFDSQGGNALVSKTASYNDVIQAPVSPTRAGYTFGGWYKEPACLNVWNFTTNSVTANTTIYAKWIINSYVVTFDSQGGNAVSSKNVNYNGAIAIRVSPTKTGYIFGGWYKEPACLNALDFATYKVTASTTIYAKWTAVAPVIETPKNFKVASSSYNSTYTTWDKVTGASGYEVYRATSSAGKYSLISTITAASYNYTGLTTNNTYYYKVRAYIRVANNDRTYSAFSAIISARPIPSMPSSLKAVSSSYNSINISWSTVSGATAYEVYRGASSGGLYKLIKTTTATKYNNTGLTTNTIYYYKVRAYRMVGSVKVYSYFLAIISSKPIPASPTGIKATRASSKSIKLTWGSTAGANGYEVYRATSSSGAYSLLTGTSYLYYTNSSLITGRTYYYKARSYRTVGKTKIYSNWTGIVYAKP